MNRDESRPIDAVNEDDGTPVSRKHKRPAPARAAGLVLAVLAPLSWAQSAHTAEVVETYGSWTLYRDQPGGKVCFLASKPSASAPANVNREMPLLYISAWSGTGVKAEVSVRLGFPGKKGLDPIVTVSSRSGDPPPSVYRMFTKDDRAFVADATQELKLLDAMKKGSKLVVESTSERGLAIQDTFTLNGITAGLVGLAGACN